MKKLLLLPLLAALLCACTPMEEKRDALLENAATLEKSRNYSGARAEVQKALDLDPAHAPAYLRLGRLDLEERNWQGANKNYLKALELAKSADGNRDEASMLEALDNLSRIAFMNNDLQKAEEYAEQAAQLNSKSADVAVIRAGILMRKNNFIDAIPLLQEALATEPNNDEAILGLASAYINTENTAKAKELLAQKLAVNPESAGVRNLILNMAIQEKDFATAEEHLKFLMSRHPDSDSLVIQLAEIYFAAGRRQEVPGLFQSFLDANPKSEKIRIRLAEMLIAAKQQDKAVELLEKGPEQTPALQLARAGILTAAARYDEAEVLLRAVLETSTGDATTIPAKYALAEVLLHNRKFVEAEDLLTSMMEQYPNEVRPQFLRGRLRAALGRYPEAIRDIENVKKRVPDDLPVALSLVDVQAAAGLDVMAEASAKEVIARSPKFLQAHMALVNVYMEQKKEKEALEALREARKAIPDNTDLILTESDLLTHLKRYNDAIKLLEELTKNDRLKELALFRISSVYAQMGNHAKAADTFARILETNPNSALAAESYVRAAAAGKQAGKALSFAQKRQKDRPNDPGTAFLVGEAYILNKKGPEAEKAFLRTLELNPAHEQALTRMMQIYSATKRIDLAIKMCKDMAAKAPESPTAPILLGMLLEQKKEMAQAEAVYRNVLEKHPDQLIAANNLAQLLSSYKPDDARLKEAEEFARKAVASEEPATLDTLGWVLYLRTQFEEAEQYLRKAHQAMPANHAITYRLATVLAAQKDAEKTGEARTLLRRITDKKLSYPEKNSAQKLLNSLK